MVGFPWGRVLTKATPRCGGLPKMDAGYYRDEHVTHVRGVNQAVSRREERVPGPSANLPRDCSSGIRRAIAHSANT